jgi:N-formylglutamate amidohydrolase
MPQRERASIEADLSPPFTIGMPRPQTSPVVLCSPHSGRVYTRHFLSQSRLDPRALRKSEDCYVDDLFSCAADLGAPLIAARFPRAYLDVNREPYELDPHLIGEPLPDYANTQSIRVAGGLGTVARIVADGEEIYRSQLGLEAVLERIDLLYVPFHRALADLLSETCRTFGYAILIDCHSMPSQASAQASAVRPEFVLGDRFGVSCDLRITRFVRDCLQKLGYDVQLNRPYAGGYITEHYGRPLKGVHALQIEINRGLYMDEVTCRPTAGYDELKADLARLCQRITTELPLLIERRAAAE